MPFSCPPSRVFNPAFGRERLGVEMLRFLHLPPCRPAAVGESDVSQRGQSALHCTSQCTLDRVKCEGVGSPHHGPPGPAPFGSGLGPQEIRARDTPRQGRQWAGAQLTCEAWRWRRGSSAKGRFRSQGRAICTLEVTAVSLSWKPAPHPRPSASTKLPPRRPGLLVPAATPGSPAPRPGGHSCPSRCPRRGSGAGQLLPGRVGALPLLRPRPSPSAHPAPGAAQSPAWGPVGSSAVSPVLCAVPTCHVCPSPHPLRPLGAAWAPCTARPAGPLAPATGSARARVPHRPCHPRRKGGRPEVWAGMGRCRAQRGGEVTATSSASEGQWP